jgi:two-component system, OmpR family, sensor kinase
MNLRTRLILSYIAIVVLCLSIAAVSVAVLLQKYRDQASLTRLVDVTRPIYVQIQSLLKGQSTIGDVWSTIQEQAEQNKVFILFVDAKGNLVRTAAPAGKSDQQFNVAGGLPHDRPQPEYGIFTTASGQKFVFAAYPIRRPEAILPRPDTVILCEPRGSVATIMAGVVRPFILAGILALAVSLILGFLMARSIYQPVQRLSRAAKNIAEGHYDESVPVSGPPEIKGLAISFNEMASKVKASQQQLRHFVADVSHQLKTPLTSIKGFAQAILDGTANDSATKERATQIIVDESNRMIRQVNELLELSRMQAGQTRMNKAPVDIKDLLLHCQDIFALRAEEKSIKIIDDIPESPTVKGDADRLEDVFSNLLDNAIKNTPSQGEIRIKVHNHNKTVEVTISDSGPGIPPEQVPHVFDRFTQTSGLRSGFGLGLAIAREIVLAHGGKIEVSSNPGEGAAFTVTLPTP